MIDGGAVIEILASLPVCLLSLVGPTLDVYASVHVCFLLANMSINTHSSFMSNLFFWMHYILWKNCLVYFHSWLTVVFIIQWFLLYNCIVYFVFCSISVPSSKIWIKFSFWGGMLYIVGTGTHLVTLIERKQSVRLNFGTVKKLFVTIRRFYENADDRFSGKLWQN